MKKISLLFVLGVLFCRHAEAGNQELDMAEATGAAVSGTAEANAWSLNNATSNTASSIIDLTAYRGIKIQVTGTAGASVKVAFSNVSYSAASFFTKLVMFPGEVATLDRHGDYVKLTTGDAPNSSVKASAITQRLGTASATVTISGTSTIQGSVNLGSISGNALTLQNGIAGSLTTVAAQLAGNLGVSVTAVAPGVSIQARTTDWVFLTGTAYAGVTTNATVTLSVTSTAGSAGYKSYWVRAKAETGVTSIRIAGHGTTTIPPSLSTTQGPEMVPGDRLVTVGIFDYTGNAAPNFSFLASALSGATSGKIWFEVWGKP